MPKIPPNDSKRLMKLLRHEDFEVIRQKGSHVILINEEKTRRVIPVHPGREIEPGLYGVTVREAGISREKFVKPLREN